MTVDQLKAQPVAVLANSVFDGANEIERLKKRLRIMEHALDRALCGLRAREAKWLADCILSEIKEAGKLALNTTPNNDTLTDCRAAVFARTRSTRARDSNVGDAA